MKLTWIKYLHVFRHGSEKKPTHHQIISLYTRPNWAKLQRQLPRKFICTRGLLRFSKQQTHRGRLKEDHVRHQKTGMRVACAQYLQMNQHHISTSHRWWQALKKPKRERKHAASCACACELMQVTPSSRSHWFSLTRFVRLMGIWRDTKLNIKLNVGWSTKPQAVFNSCFDTVFRKLTGKKGSAVVEMQHRQNCDYESKLFVPR